MVLTTVILTKTSIQSQFDMLPWYKWWWYSVIV